MFVVRFNPVPRLLTHASLAVDIAGFGEIGEKVAKTP